jgi:post-segregation antitoxin (ccd killing protein)
MGRPKAYNNLVARIVYIEKDDIDFIKSKGVNTSKLVRQAINDYKEGNFIYKY